MNQATSTRISVVVIGRNEGARLSACLASVMAADRAGHELQLIYVDSDSSDDSIARAQACGARVIGIRPTRPSAAAGRNAGWRVATGQWVLFLDGDTQLDHDFLPRALDEIGQASDLAAIWGHRRESRPAASIYNRVLDLDWIYPPGDTAFCGGDALFRRAALDAVGGFDDSLIAGEEPELCARLRAAGWRIRHIDAPMTRHDLAITQWRQYWRRAERAGHAYAEISARFAHLPDGLWRQDARRNRLHGAVLLGGTAITLAAAIGGHPLVLAGALCTATAVLLRTAWRARWKCDSAATLLLYAAHSHLQQLPILWGQLAWRRAQFSGRRRRLIEYKDPSA